MLCAFCVCEFLGILILSTSRHLTLTFLDRLFAFFCTLIDQGLWLSGSGQLLESYHDGSTLIACSYRHLVEELQSCTLTNNQTKEGNTFGGQGIPLGVLTNRLRHYSLDSSQLSWFQRILCNNKKYPIRTSESSDLPV